jgi:hypothetical protein
MQITVTPIPDGSHELRVFDDGHDPETAPIDAVCNLLNRGEGVCEVSLAHGHLYDQANIQIGIEAYRLGYDVLRFYATRDIKVTRHATRIGESPNYYFYEIDLAAKAREMGVER